MGAVSLGAASAATRERDGGNSKGAGLLGLAGLRRVDNGDVLGTTALGVCHNGTRRRAGRSVLASRAVRHVVVKLQVTVELGVDVELAN